VVRSGVCGRRTLGFVGAFGDAGADSSCPTLRAFIGGDVEDCGGRTGVAICEALAAGFEESAESANRAFPWIVAKEGIDMFFHEGFTTCTSKFPARALWTFHKNCREQY